MAKQHVTMAEIWESEPDQNELAIEHYQKASQIFRGEEQQSQANKCDLKAASMLAKEKKYEQAIQLFEQVNKAILELFSREMNELASKILKYRRRQGFDT